MVTRFVMAAIAARSMGPALPTVPEATRRKALCGGFGAAPVQRLPRSAEQMADEFMRLHKQRYTDCGTLHRSGDGSS